MPNFLMPDFVMRPNAFKRIISQDEIKLCLAENLKKSKSIQYFLQSVLNIVNSVHCSARCSHLLQIGLLTNLLGICPAQTYIYESLLVQSHSPCEHKAINELQRMKWAVNPRILHHRILLLHGFWNLKTSYGNFEYRTLPLEVCFANTQLNYSKWDSNMPIR